MVAMVPREQGVAPLETPELLELAVAVAVATEVMLMVVLVQNGTLHMAQVEVVVVVSAVMRAELPVVGDSTVAVVAAEMVVPQLRTAKQGRRALLLSPILLQLCWLLQSLPTRRNHFRPRSPPSSATSQTLATRQAQALPMASPTAPTLPSPQSSPPHQ